MKRWPDSYLWVYAGVSWFCAALCFILGSVSTTPAPLNVAGTMIAVTSGVAIVVLTDRNTP